MRLSVHRANGMQTGRLRKAVIALVAIASTSLLAQGARQSPAEFQRMLQMGLAHRTASELYSALKNAAGGGRQSP